MITGRFIITEIGKIKASIALGDFVIDDGKKVLFAHQARSGGYGKGPLETGDYEISWMDYRKGDAFTLFGYGWAAFLNPLFASNRDEIMIHPDGNVPGSLGCVAIPFINLEENVKCSHIISEALEIQHTIPFSVLQILKGKPS